MVMAEPSAGGDNDSRVLSTLCWIPNPFAYPPTKDIQCNYCGRLLLLQDDDDRHAAVERCGCGTPYCGNTNESYLSCRQRDATVHRMLCVAADDDDSGDDDNFIKNSSPRYQLKVLALQAGLPHYYATIMLATTLIITLSTTNNTNTDCLEIPSFLLTSDRRDKVMATTSTTTAPDDDTCILDTASKDEEEGGDSDYESYNSALDDLAHASYPLLQKVITDRPHAQSSSIDDDDNNNTSLSPASTTSFETWRRLLHGTSQHYITGTTRSRYALEIEQHSNDEAYWQLSARQDDDNANANTECTTTSGGGGGGGQRLLELLREEEEVEDRNEQQDEDVSSLNSEDEEHADTTGTATLPKAIELLMDEPDMFFPPAEWFAIAVVEPTTTRTTIAVTRPAKDDDVPITNEATAVITYNDGRDGEGDAGTTTSHVVIRHSCLPTHDLKTNAHPRTIQIQRSCREVGIVEIPAVDSEVDDDDKEPKSTTKGKYNDCGMTISLVQNDLEYAERTEVLKERGISCECLRCRFEGAGLIDDKDEEEDRVDDNSFHSFRDLARLLDLAKRQRRIDDAMAVVSAQVEYLFKDNDGTGGGKPSSLSQTAAHGPPALFEQARIAGWQGDFTRREALLSEAIDKNADGVGPQFEPLRDAWEEANAYYRRKRDYLQSSSPTRTSSRHSWKQEGDGIFVGENILDPHECNKMIEMVERVQSQQLGNDGWSTSRHYAVPTTDVSIHTIPELLAWFNLQLEHTLFPEMEDHFGIIDSEARLRMLDAFMVKYDATGGQKRLPLHNDESDYSLTISMNAKDEYQGGGTYFFDLDCSLRTDTGGVVSFCGDLVHAGHSITSGKRYIIVCFIWLETFANDVGGP